MCKGLNKSSSNKITNVDEQEVAPSKKNVRAACPMDNSSFFFEPSGVSISTDTQRNASASLLRAVGYFFLQKEATSFNNVINKNK